MTPANIQKLIDELTVSSQKMIDGGNKNCYSLLDQNISVENNWIKVGRILYLRTVHTVPV
jgi:hypothetical protein